MQPGSVLQLKWKDVQDGKEVEQTYLAAVWLIAPHLFNTIALHDISKYEEDKGTKMEYTNVRGEKVEMCTQMHLYPCIRPFAWSVASGVIQKWEGQCDQETTKKLQQNISKVLFDSS